MLLHINVLFCFIPVGIKYEVVEYRLGENVMKEGLYIGTPGFRFITFPNVFRTIEFEDLKVLY